MAPRSTSKKPVEQAVAGENVESEQETLDPKTVSKDMEKNTHARKVKKRNQLSAKYQQEMASLDEQILSITKSATKLLADIRRDQQQRLHELVRRRTEVEDQIVQHSQVLHRAYEGANKEMKAAARGRLEDLRSNNEDDEELGSHAGGIDGRLIPGKEAVKNAEDMARKGMRV